MPVELKPHAPYYLAFKNQTPPPLPFETLGVLKLEIDTSPATALYLATPNYWLVTLEQGFLTRAGNGSMDALGRVQKPLKYR